VKHNTRLVPSILIGGLVLAGGGSVLAAAGGSASKDSSSQQQYCPPNSPGGGQPQGGPNNNCGNPPDNCPNGNPKPPDGNCGNGNPNGPPENPGKGKGKGAKFHVKRKPVKRCYRHRFALHVKVTNKGKGKKTFVYRDGHRVKSSRRKSFTVILRVGRLSPGVHKLKLRVKGADGKTHTRTIKFRRC
jgi:hypothetical protein